MIPQYIRKWWRNSIKINQTTFKVNCWFCNENSIIKVAEKEGWTCGVCEQFNGFTPDGDYNQPIKEQQDVKLHKTDTFCSSEQVQKVPSLLCEICSQNQVIKVRQLAAFSPFNEFEYEKEIDMYKDYLENVYTLCSKCQKEVDDYLSSQNAEIICKMDTTQRQILDSLHQKVDLRVNAPGIVTGNNRHQKAIILKMIFFLSTLFPVLLLTANLRLYLGSSTSTLGSLSTGYFGQFSSYLVSSIPARLALDVESKAVFSGAVVCLVGLFFTGKYRLYPEDAFHLLLWLLTTLNGFSLLAVPLTLTMTLNFVTLIISIKCCVRNRVPRNFSFGTVQRKTISRKSVSPIVTNENKEAVEEEAAHSGDVSKLDSSCKSELPVMADDKSPHFETVRQNLESFSLGLGQKSGSNSSIWSQAPVVTSSSSTDLSPDSSSDLHMLPKRLLSPSRLGFLSFDSQSSSKDSNSRSPSPWSPISSNTSASNSLTPLVSSADPLGTWTHHQQSEPEMTRPRPCVLTSQHGYLSPKHSGLYTKFPQAPLTTESNSSEYLQGPCDSQMCESPLKNASPRTWQDMGNNLTYGLRNQNLLENLSLNPKPKALRRSHRIAMAGRRPKPWPLQKSLSCTNAYDKYNLESLCHSNIEANTYVRNGPAFASVVNSLGHIRESDKVQSHEDPHIQSQPRSNLRSQRIKVSRGDKNSKKSAMGEISDDERDDCHISWSHGGGNYVAEHKNDFSWKWISLGLLIGVSVTTNVFLMLNRYLPSAL